MKKLLILIPLVLATFATPTEARGLTTQKRPCSSFLSSINKMTWSPLKLSGVFTMGVPNTKDTFVGIVLHDDVREVKARINNGEFTIPDEFKVESSEGWYLPYDGKTIISCSPQTRSK